MIWFSADTHYYHRNIIKGISTWDNTNNCRDFPDMDSHNNAIVDGINKVVGEDDTLYHLGDWSFGGINQIWNFRKRLVVKDIHLILGNHDHHVVKNKILPNVWGGDITRFGFPTYFTNNETNIAVKARELFSVVRCYDEIKVEGHRIVLGHYAFRVWNRSHKGSFNLHGHSHSSLPPIGKQLDVGVDNAYKLLGEYRPFSFQEIQKIMAKREIHKPDHHDKNTN